MWLGAGGGTDRRFALFHHIHSSQINQPYELLYILFLQQAV